MIAYALKNKITQAEKLKEFSDAPSYLMKILEPTIIFQ